MILSFMVTVEDLARSGVCSKFWNVQLVCKKGGESVPTTVVKVTEVVYHKRILTLSLCQNMYLPRSMRKDWW